MHSGWSIVALLEMYQPRCLSMPGPQALANHFEVIPHRGMEDQGKGCEASTGDLIRKISDTKMFFAKFVDRNISRSGFRYGCDIVKLSRVFRQRIAHIIELFVKQMLDR